MTQDDELIAQLNKRTPMAPGARWVTVKEIQWDQKTMTATSVSDGLDYFEVQLGLGSFYRRPKVGSIALIGTPMQEEAAGFLIDCASLDEEYIEDSTGFKWHLNEGLLKINGESFEGLVKAPELKLQVDKNTAILEAIQKAFQQWVPSPSDGGAALKAQVATIPTMERADLKNIQNKKILHGDG